MTLEKYRDKAMQLCSVREYCRKDIFDKIVSWGCTSADANNIVDFLEERNFLDERRYIEAYIKDKLRFNKWGRVKIAFMLRSKNIDRNLIQEVLANVDETEYMELLLNELQKKHRSIKRDKDYEQKGKLFRFATSRGFEPEIVNEAILRML